MSHAFDCPRSPIQLEALNLNCNDLNEIPYKTLSTFKKSLKALSLDRNEFIALGEVSFPKMPELFILTIRYSRIRKIKRVMFSNLHGLHQLYLDYNRLKVVPAALFKNFTYVSLAGNPFITWGKEGKALPKPNAALGVCNLSDQFFYIGNNTLSRISNLEVLNLKYLVIPQIGRNMFASMNGLRVLDISSISYLRKIEEGSFQDLQSLQYLNLEESICLQIMSNTTFVGLENLIIINFNQSRTSFKNNCCVDGPLFHPNVISPFLRLDNLKILSLASVGLQSLSSAMFKNLKKLETLHLQKNKIISWDTPQLITNVRSLSLFLSYNTIRILTKAMIKDLCHTKQVDLSYNRFSCDCQLFTLADIANNHSLSRVMYFETYDHYMCYDKTINKKIYMGNMTAKAKYCRDDKNPQHDVPFEEYVLLLVLPVIFAGLVLSCTVGLCYWKRWYVHYIFYLLKIKVKVGKAFANADGFLYDAFVVYNDKDSNFVHGEFKKELERNEIKLCLHERDFVVGTPIIENIVKSVERSQKVVLIISKHFVNSRWCLFEMQIAQQHMILDRRCGMIIVRLESLPSWKIPSTLKYLMKTHTHITWSPNITSSILFWAKLKNAILKDRLIMTERGLTKDESFA